MVERKINKQEWRSCASDELVRLPCFQIADLEKKTKELRLTGGRTSHDFEMIKQEVDCVMLPCQAVQKWNHDKSREFQALPCDELRYSIKMRYRWLQ